WFDPIRAHHFFLCLSMYWAVRMKFCRWKLNAANSTFRQKMLHPQIILFATYWWDCLKLAITQTAKSWDLLVVLLAIVGSSFFGSLTGYEVTIHQPLELALAFFSILLFTRFLFIVPFQKWQLEVQTIESLEASRTTQQAVDELAELLSEGISRIWNSFP